VLNKGKIHKNFPEHIYQ